MKKRFLAAAVSAAIATLPMTATAYEAGDWIIRGGAASVNPDESSSLVNAGVLGPVADTELTVSNDTQLGLTFTYMFSSHLGLELLASTPFEHDVELKGNGLSPIVPNGTKVATVKHLPPTLSLQYFFMDGSSAWQPYAGIGINYWLVTSEKLSDTAKSALLASNLKVDDSIGLSLQLGMDYAINDNWLLNVAVWNIDIDTEAKFQSAVGEVSADIDIDPWVYMVGVGYKF